MQSCSTAGCHDASAKPPKPLSLPPSLPLPPCLPLLQALSHFPCCSLRDVVSHVLPATSYTSCRAAYPCPSPQQLMLLNNIARLASLQTKDPRLQVCTLGVSLQL